ncbi:hypothetical protein G6O69_14560 [Pseudenhygromyxa sp. WMMC2535]|uniref:hypothetical protein n=1 Tax=Pseudenhygromyxa sp. WMMC2535 TaxID=2712867 RepID=UPI0015569439|nr:hypothetical protein [Pseudenhygromyxa sp. WMMC2535]NVB39062.1 hypothetical protein [Pseudenhygromyxa sp. WMMC2535]
MPKKIDDVLNPKPNSIEEGILVVLSHAAKEGLALTKPELLSSCRVNWLDVAPVGEGGILLALGAALVDSELGISKHMDEQREAALTKLVEQGRVKTRRSNEAQYYWVEKRPEALTS